MSEYEYELYSSKEKAPQACNKCVELQAKLDVAVDLLESIDQHLCEHIIDSCGYDPAEESHSDLICTVQNNSEDNEEQLINLRRALKKIKEQGE